MEVTEETLRELVRRRVIVEEIRSLKKGGKLIKEQQAGPAYNSLQPQTQSELKTFVNVAEQFQGGSDVSDYLNLSKGALQSATFFGGLGATTVAGVAGTLWGGFYGGLASASLMGAIAAAGYAAIGQWSNADLSVMKGLLSPSSTANNVKNEVDGLLSQLDNKRIRLPACTNTSTTGGSGPSGFSAFVDPNDIANPQDFLGIPLGGLKHESLPSQELSRKATNILNNIHQAANETFSSGNKNLFNNIKNEFTSDGITLYDLHQIDAKVGEMIDNGSYAKLQFRAGSFSPTTDFDVSLQDFKSYYQSNSGSNIIYLLQNIVDFKNARMFTDEEIQAEFDNLPLENLTKDAIFSLPGDVSSALQCYINSSQGTLAYYQVKTVGGQQRTNIGQNFFASIGLTMQQKMKNAYNALARIFNRMIAFARSTGSTILASAMSGVQTVVSTVKSLVSGVMAAFSATAFGQWLEDTIGQVGQIISGILEAIIQAINGIISYFKNKNQPAKTKTAPGKNTKTSAGGGGKPSGGSKGGGGTNKVLGAKKATGPRSSAVRTSPSGGYIKVNLTGDPSVRSLTDVGFINGSTRTLYDDLYSKAPRNYVGSEDLNFKIKMEEGAAGNRRVVVRLARGERRRALRGLEAIQPAIKKFFQNVQIVDSEKFSKIPAKNGEKREFELVVKLGSKR